MKSTTKQRAPVAAAPKRAPAGLIVAPVGKAFAVALWDVPSGAWVTQPGRYLSRNIAADATGGDDVNMRVVLVKLEG